MRWAIRSPDGFSASNPCDRLERTFGWMTRWRRLVRDYETRFDGAHAGCAAPAEGAPWVRKADRPRRPVAGRSKSLLRSPAAGSAGTRRERAWMEREKAIALDFDPRDPSVPTVIATGVGDVARQILAVAFEHGIKVREDPDLIEILSKLEVGDEIPIVAFAAVAEIMTHVYRWELQQRSPSEHSPT